MRLVVLKVETSCKKCGKILKVGSYANETNRGNVYCPECAPIPKISSVEPEKITKIELTPIRTVYGPDGKPLKVKMDAKP
jgi:Zn finger protein HypA/HybF involved in hydrogenase expression